MTPQQIKEIREEFYKVFPVLNDLPSEHPQRDVVADYWLTILDKALSQQREEMREKVGLIEFAINENDRQIILESKDTFEAFGYGQAWMIIKVLSLLSNPLTK